MNKLSVVLIIAALLAGAAGSYFLFRPHGGEEAATGNTTDYYTCPMHLSVRSDRPGACPVCGMALVRKSAIQEVSDPASLRRVSLSPTQRVLANISTVPARRRTVRADIRATGFLSVAEPLQAIVAARFRGRIEKLHVTFTGATVRKGATLFELYSPDLISAEREFLIALESGGATGGALLDASRDRLRIHFGLTETQVRELEARRTVHSTLSFFSPLAGVVLEKNVQEGEYVGEGMVLYRLANLSSIWAYVDVYEKDLRFAAPGREVRIITEAFPGRTFTGRVTFVDPVINPETRTVRVRAELPNPGGSLRPNMYVQAEIAVPGAELLSVPAAAVLSTGARDVVWVETAENAFEPRAVTVGVRNEDFAQILDGLSEGEMVAATGGYLLDSESALQLPSGTDPHSGHAVVPTVDTETGREEVAVSGLAGGSAPSVPAGHGMPSKTAGGKAADRATQDLSGHVHSAVSSGGGSAETPGTVRITVKSGYAPGVIRVKVGQPLTLEFVREEDSACSEEIVFPTLGIRKRLPAFRTTTIRLGPQKAGEIPFECGMGMLEGKLVVEP
jgi:Cu(I)/Ag(I) efflux system membrane fusion protein